MRGGRHFTEFAISDGGPDIYQGVIRPVSLTNDIDLEADWKGSVHPTARLFKLQTCSIREIEIPEDCEMEEQQCPLLRLLLS